MPKENLADWLTSEEAIKLIMAEEQCSREEAEKLLMEFAKDRPDACRFEPTQ